MGLLKDGEWHTDWYDTDDGEFERDESAFRHWLTADGSPGPDGQQGFPAEAGRYRLYVSYACPWAHRTLIMRRLKDLDDLIPVSVVDPEMMEDGWSFSGRFEGNEDPEHDVDFLHQLYTIAKPDYSGRVTVPVLWDTRTDTIVNNESSEIIRMFNTAFNDMTGNHADFYPDDLRGEIEAINKPVYNNVNNGVYKTGFATDQAVYERECRSLFDQLDELEERLSEHRFLVGNHFTEADIRLFTTLIRFDAVYHGHFKCNIRQIADYSNLFNFLLDIHQRGEISDTVHMDHIQKHYYYSHTMVNPNQIVPLGPDQDLARRHDRARHGDAVIAQRG